MNERYTTALEEVLLANRRGEAKNLLFTDGDAEFLEGALSALRAWSARHGINLVEIDEREDAWLLEMQSHALLDKLNRRNTVLLIKNYATVNFYRIDLNAPRTFLRELVLNHRYLQGGSPASPEEISGLLFTVAVNDLSEMRWRSDEYTIFSVIHRDSGKKFFVNTAHSHPGSKMHPVLSSVNKVKYFVSDDAATLCFDVRDAFCACVRKHPIGNYSADERSEIIHTYLENNLPEFCDQVVCLILKMGTYGEEEQFRIDGKRLMKAFPNLRSIYCKDTFEIVGAEGELSTMDPFSLGELCFNLAQDGDIPMANAFCRELWALDFKWSILFREVARDYYRKPGDRQKHGHGSALHRGSGMDHLFHIYLSGWYQSEDDRVLVKKHKNFDKAIALLSIRFRHCSVDEVAEKLFWDLQHVKMDADCDDTCFSAILSEAERLVPGVTARMQEKGWIGK